MFDVDICQERRVILFRFHGLLSPRDFDALDKLAAENKGAVPYDSIFDLTAIERVDLATNYVAARGDLPQAHKDRERIYVVQQDDLKLLVRLYAAYQENKGWRPPLVVATLDEALNRLGVNASDFARYRSTRAG
ncbi:hypothetical protein SAMN02990966_08038 [Rhodospirillales bacterium URHD0017]|nr:hypothetical protein SAMN02990966_08038 [Rhodospirillales bacterium URHD0017]